MKKVALLFIVLFWLASCAKVNGPDAVEQDPVKITAELEDVIKKMNSLIDDLYGPSTRSGGAMAIASIEPVSGPATRSGDSEPLAYIVNFEDNSGFALVSTNPASDDVIAVSNNGTLTKEEFDFAYSLVSDDAYWTALSEEDDDMEDDPEDILYGDEQLPPSYFVAAPFSESFISNAYEADSITEYNLNPAALYLAEYVFVTDFIYNKRIADDPGDGSSGGVPPDPVWGAWTSTGGVAPLIRTKWGQGKPYNDKYPYRGSDRAPAGCTIIATAQIAAFYKKPSGVNWDAISNYSVYIGGVQNTPPGHADILATYLYSLSQWMNATYTSSGTSAATSKAASYFRQKVNLSSVNRHGYKWSRVRDRLNIGVPVYMHGFHDKGGHTYLLDGYMYQRRYDTRPGYTSSYQSRTLLHINWGWSEGSHDGYYVEGVFDPSKRAEEIDAGVGDQGNPASGKKEYTKRLKTLTWKKP